MANPESACFASTSDQPGQELSNSLPLRGKYCLVRHLIRQGLGGHPRARTQSEAATTSENDLNETLALARSLPRMRFKQCLKLNVSGGHSRTGPASSIIWPTISGVLLRKMKSPFERGLDPKKSGFNHPARLI